MAVPEQIPVVNYVADGIVKKFDVPFEYDQQSDLHVYVDGAEPTIDKYFFADNAFNFYIAPTSGQAVKIKRITPKERDTDYDLHTNTVRPKALNADFDRVWYVLQEVFSDVGGLSQAVQDEIIARIQGDEDLLNQLTAEISARMLGDEAVTEDLKNYVNQVVGAIVNDPDFDGIDAKNVNDASGETQQQVNYNGGSKWHSRVGGYQLNEHALLDDGTEVISTIPNNTNDPNVNMTGWVKTNSASQIFDGSGKSQQEINDQTVNIKEFGGDPTDFDPSVAETAAKAVANPNALPYIGARQVATPMQTLKVWNYCDGYLDRGAVASIRNVASFDSAEPRTEVLGINNSAQLASYTDRDVVGLYVQTEGQPALITSTNTTYTATTVTCPDIEPKRNFIRKDQIIDVLDGDTKYSSRIQGLVGNTITVDGWYMHGTSNTGTPSTGSQVKFVPNTKVWATNFNVMLKPESDAQSMVGIELGVFNNKYSNHTGYGYDIWSGGTYPINQAFQARGKYYSGLHLQGEYQFGVISEACNNISFYDKDSPVGFLSQGSDYGVVLKDTKNQALDVQDVTGKSLTSMSPTGAWRALKYEISVINTPTTIDQTSVMIFVDPNVNGMVVDLPTPSDNERRTIFVKNLSATNTVFLAGVVENGGGSYHLQTKETVQMICDAVTWFPISKYQG